MLDEKRWLLPEGVEELLPDQARLVERLRRQLLDLFDTWGYELVVTPLIEYVESLLLGRGDELDLQTFKLTDQLSGRLMGVRADITPQVARIDARHLINGDPSRLCYVGTVLHTRLEGFARTRQPIQVGAELYGHAGLEGDIEIIHLMVETLSTAGVAGVFVDLGHVGIFRAMARRAQLDKQHESALFEAVQRKARADIAQLLSDANVAPKWQEHFFCLVDLNGDVDVLQAAANRLASIDPAIDSALQELQTVAQALTKRLPTLNLRFDLAELRGYDYKTGLVFAAFVARHGQELARGGRYDNIGADYGRARPATGFSTDLMTLLRLAQAAPARATAILAPWREDSKLMARIAQLRQQGERVIVALPGQPSSAEGLGCDRELIEMGGRWEVQPV